MPEGRYFLRLGGAFVLGIIAIIIAVILFFLFLPWILAFAVGTIMLVFVLIVIWVIVYAAIFIGVAIYYFFKPMKVEKKDKGYSISKAKEAGKRQKGKSKKKA
jgi:membrane protein implicated in regulation of membrane protease activity